MASKLPKCLYVTVSILHVFIRVYDVNYVETQLNKSKTSRLHKFVRNGQNDYKLCKRSFFHKINKNMQSNPGMKYFVHSRV